MSNHLKMTRRQALTASAALPLAAGALGAAPAFAAAEMKGAAVANFHRFVMGDFEVTTLGVGARTVENPQGIFGMNASAAEFAAASEEAFLPTDKMQIGFTPTIVNTGAELVLFDTGLSPDAITSTLAAAGYTPDQVDKVIITHMHGDHIGGLYGEGGETFKNASYYAGAAENNHWSGADNDTYKGKVAPLAEKFTFVDDGASPVSGITGIAAAGHTPGHMTYMIESDGKGLMLIGDAANHPVWSIGHPDWEVRFDMDKAAAAATRRKILGQIAADKIPFIGYHMPFPAVGYLQAKGDGFGYVPASYQLAL